MSVRQSITKLGILPLLCTAIYAADTAPGVPVSLLITVEGKGSNRDSANAAATTDTLKVVEDHGARSVVGLNPLEGSRTQMLLLIDDSAGGSFDTQIPDVKKFIESLPQSVEIAVGYMRNGTSQMTSEFTNEHAKAAQSLRLPLGSGGADVSPYDSLAEAVKKWPVNPDVKRREVIMISSGIEGLGGGVAPENPYVNAGIEAAQKAGVVVYAIYNPSSGSAGRAFGRATWGQNFLSQLTEETGGELYEVGFGSSVSFTPYLEDIMKRQAQQFILTFDAEAEKKSGLQSIKISSMGRSFSVSAPDKVYVKASL